MFISISAGYQCEQHNNPADFFLDVIIENEEADGLEGIASIPTYVYMIHYSLQL